MIAVGGENLIDYVQTGLSGGLPIYTAIPGGSCYNVAIAIARQNQVVKYVTPISTDNFGSILSERLITDGVILGTERVDAPTSLAVVSISDGEPRYQFYRNNTAERQINTDLLDSVIEKSTRIFHIGSLSLIEGEDANVWESKFRSFSSQGIITSLDPNARSVAVTDKPSYIARLFRMLPHTCVLKLSDEDLIYIIPNTSLKDAFNQLCAKTSAELIILTKGAKGALVKTPSYQFQVKAVVPRPLRDTVGAGDTFMGTILTELHKRCLVVEEISKLSYHELRKMVDRASIAAALNCQSTGCNPPYEKDLLS